jgi:GntR family transcriptional regulator of vanillate catabolism
VLAFSVLKGIRCGTNQMGREFQRLNFAHRQHHAVVKALRSGQGARAEALMREHAYAVLNYVDLFNSLNQTNTQVSIIRST